MVGFHTVCPPRKLEEAEELPRGSLVRLEDTISRHVFLIKAERVTFYDILVFQGRSESWQQQTHWDFDHKICRIYCPTVVELHMQLPVPLVKDSLELAATVPQHYASQQSTRATLLLSPPPREVSV